MGGFLYVQNFPVFSLVFATPYLYGAFSNDTGKKWFAFSRMEIGGEGENVIGSVFYWDNGKYVVENVYFCKLIGILR